MASTQSFLFLSNETPNTSNPLSLYLWYILMPLGCSMRTGLHHAAQKSIHTYVPRKEDRATVSPSGVGKAMSGAIYPIGQLRIPFTEAPNCCAYLELRIPCS